MRSGAAFTSRPPFFFAATRIILTINSEKSGQVKAWSNPVGSISVFPIRNPVRLLPPDARMTASARSTTGLLPGAERGGGVAGSFQINTDWNEFKTVVG